MFVPHSGVLVANRYQLRRVIGRGGMGEVWAAHDQELDSPCAVKFIVEHLAQDPGARARFLREARAAARLRSPHAVNILGVGEHASTMYLAMELLEGETLARRIERTGKLDSLTTLAVVEQTAQVLDRAHRAGIVHRDLKPDNLWLTAEPQIFVKVLDFGVAKSTLSMTSKHTSTGALIGTPHYMSPEQARGDREVDHRSDLWSLAIIAVECMGGRRPFESTGLGDLLVKIVATPPPPVRALAPELPVTVEAWWERALAREPSQRFQSGAELVAALRQSLGAALPGSARAPRLSEPERPREGPEPSAPLEPAAATLIQGAPGTGVSGPNSREPSPLPSMSPLAHTRAPARSRARARRWWGAGAGLAVLGAGAWLLARSRTPPSDEAALAIEREPGAAAAEPIIDTPEAELPKRQAAPTPDPPQPDPPTSEPPEREPPTSEPSKQPPGVRPISDDSVVSGSPVEGPPAPRPARRDSAPASTNASAGRPSTASPAARRRAGVTPSAPGQHRARSGPVPGPARSRSRTPPAPPAAEREKGSEEDELENRLGF